MKWVIIELIWLATSLAICIGDYFVSARLAINFHNKYQFLQDFLFLQFLQVFRVALAKHLSKNYMRYPSVKMMKAQVKVVMTVTRIGFQVQKKLEDEIK